VGLCLKTEELVKAFKRVHFNAFVQLFNFGAVSLIVFGFSRLMMRIGILSTVLADGMVICSCLPIIVNLFEVLTKLEGGGKLQESVNHIELFYITPPPQASRGHANKASYCTDSHACFVVLAQLQMKPLLSSTLPFPT
jgi:hypothetical protein